MKICVDTSILLDILKDEFIEYQEKLYEALRRKEELIAPAIVAAELVPQFKGDTKLLQSFLHDHKIVIKSLDIDSALLAASRWMRYLKRKTKVKCPECGHKLDLREHVLSDFYIGGFALTECDVILTRDRGIYKKYFPDLKNY